MVREEAVDIPKDWLDATLVCLFKGKGSRKDPATYRGISLISSVEKLMSIIVLNRIKVHVDKRLMQGQNGFRPLKSCRGRSVSLMEGNGEKQQGEASFIKTFIYYSKAFDSLAWANLCGGLSDLQDVPKK